MLQGLISLVVAYVLGSIPFGYLLVRWTTGADVRASGSGNIGATNVLRTTGRGAGIATLLLDLLKGAAAVWISGWLTDGSPLWTSLAALVVMAGHAFPVLLGGKGGKAVASFTGAFAVLAPVPMLATAIVFFVVVAKTRFISAGSIIGAAMFPFGVWLIMHPPAPVLIASFIAGVFIIWRHQGNVERLRAGTENVFSWKKK
jgi:glycerol-3-phosphate acyltransferase PlsY